MEGREPCPYRIVDDVGGAFCMGSIGGGIWHYFKGVRNAPKGERLRGGISSVKARAPIVGGVCVCVCVCVRLRLEGWEGEEGRIGVCVLAYIYILTFSHTFTFILCRCFCRMGSLFCQF